MARKRRRTDFNRVGAMLGAIRIRTQYTPRDAGGFAPPHRKRYIKVNNDRPAFKRWISYARWWWEKNRGPVPPGLRVVHLNGDTMDDRPENYGLLTGGQVAQLYLRLRPEVRECNRRNAGRATSVRNLDQGRVGRQLCWLGSRWYAVDVARRQILAYATRSRRQLVALLGGEASINGKVVKRPSFILVRGSELPGNYEGFARVVPEYRPWRRGLQDVAESSGILSPATMVQIPLGPAALLEVAKGE